MLSKKTTIENGLAKTNSVKVGIVLRFVVSFGLLAALFYWLPAKDILKNILSLPGYFCLICILLFLATHSVAALKWRYLLNTAGLTIKRFDAIRAHAAGLFFNICLPTIVGGDVIRASMVVRTKDDLGEVAMASIVDRLIDTLALVLLMLVAALFLDELPAVEIGNYARYGWVLLIVIFFVAALFLFKNKSKVQKLVAKIRSAVKPFQTRPMLWLVCLGLSLSIQSIFILINIAIAIQLGINQPWQVWFFCWPAAKLVALAPISLGGLGVRDAAIVSLLSFYGVAGGIALSQSLTWQSILIVSGLGAGAAAILTGKGKPRMSAKLDQAHPTSAHPISKASE